MHRIIRRQKKTDKPIKRYGNLEKAVNSRIKPVIERYLGRLNPLIEATERIQEILEDKIDTTNILQMKTEEDSDSESVISRPVFEPKEKRIEFIVEK